MLQMISRPVFRDQYDLETPLFQGPFAFNAPAGMLEFEFPKSTI